MKICEITTPEIAPKGLNDWAKFSLRGLLRAYGTYVGVRGRLEDGESCEQHEDGQEEEDVSGSIVHKGHLGGRIEQECSQRI